MQNYQKAVEKQPGRNDLQYDLGDAAYKTGDYSEAEDAFRKALETPDLGLQENTYYNLGNSQYEHGAAMQKVDTKKTIGIWEQALHSYDSALKLKTTADARHNYEFVKKKLEELKKQQQQQTAAGQERPVATRQKRSIGPEFAAAAKATRAVPATKPQQQNPSGQNNPQNGNQKNQGSGDQSKPQDQSGAQGQDKNDRRPPAGKDSNNTQQSAYSGTRDVDKQDPGIKSRQDAENLLDSLKDDERHVTARVLNGIITSSNRRRPPRARIGRHESGLASFRL